MVPPLAVDIDGTLTRPDQPYGIDPRVLDVLRGWPEPLVVATGKAFPFPVALAHFTGLEENVIAENGGVVLADGEVHTTGQGEAARTVYQEFEAAGGDPGWSLSDTMNRWRETEVVVELDADEALLREVAAEYGLEVVDTGYAYHVKDTDVTKATGLAAVCDLWGMDPGEFVAVGDSENDAALFEVVDRSYAVANADDVARAAAAEQLEGAHADGFLEAVDLIRARAE